MAEWTESQAWSAMNVWVKLPQNRDASDDDFIAVLEELYPVRDLLEA